MTHAPTNVLLVDDDEALLGAVAFALQTEGYAVRTCRSLEAALRTTRMTRMDCLVIDYRLESGSGLDLAQALRRSGVQAPVILITTNPDARCRALAAKAGAVIVEKPLLGDGLTRQIKSSIALAASSQ